MALKMDIVILPKLFINVKFRVLNCITNNQDTVACILFIRRNFIWKTFNDISAPVFKASKHSFKRFTSRLLKLSFYLSLRTYIPRVNVMLDFIGMVPVDLSGAGRKRQNTK